MVNPIEQALQEGLVKKLKKVYPDIERKVELIILAREYGKEDYTPFVEMEVEGIWDYLIKLYHGDRLAKKFYKRFEGIK